MAQNTPINALPWPELGDIPNAQTAFQNLANQLDTRLVPRFANDAARQAAITSPVAGMLSYQNDSARYEYYTGSSWQPVVPPDYRQAVTLSSPASAVFLNGIPSTPSLVTLYWTARSDAALINTGVQVRVNNDLNTVYSGQKMQGSGSATPTSSTFVTSSFADCGSTLAASATAGRFGSGSIELTGWNNPHSGKLNGIAKYGAFDVAASNSFTGQTSWFYDGAGPYYELVIFPGAGNWVAGSEFLVVATQF